MMRGTNNIGTNVCLTKAQRRALEAVHNGKVWRSYNSNGNLIKTPSGIGARPVYDLESMMLIRERRGSSRWSTSRFFELTEIGRAELEAARE